MELNQLRYPFAEQASQINGFVLKEEKKAYIAGLGRDQLEHLASPMTKSESIEKRLESGLEYYSPTWHKLIGSSETLHLPQLNLYRSATGYYTCLCYSMS